LLHGPCHQALGHRLSAMNPFLNSVVADPWDAREIDVPEINAEAFELCTRALARVGRTGHSEGVLLHGEPGSGKTHLLNRLRAHVKNQPRLHLFAAVRLQSSPHRFWRYLRACLIENFIKPDKAGKTQMERLIGVRLYRAFRRTRVADLDEYRGLLSSLALEAGLSSSLCRALELVVRRKYMLDAVSWLKGESLPESSLKRLDLAVELEADADPEDQAREFVLGFMRLAGPTVPVVLCFDQVESLQRYKKGDPESLYKFGQAVATLHDKTGNMLLVSCIQSLFLDVLKTAVMSPDYDRLSSRTTTMNPLNAEQALALASARVKAFHPGPRGRDPSFLEILRKEIPEYVGRKGEVARKVLLFCANLYESRQPDPPRPQAAKSTEEFLGEQKEVRIEKSIQTFSPGQTDEVLQTAVPVLLNALDERWTEEDEKRPRDVDILLNGPGRRIGISLCNHRNMVSLAGKLRRLLKLPPDSGLDQLILVRHSGLPITRGARRTREYLEELQGRRTALLQPDTETLAVLQALSSLFADAKSGDLARDGEILGDGSVREWLRRHMDPRLQDFMEEFTGPRIRTATGEEERILQDLLEFIHREKVAAASEAARSIGAAPEEVIKLLQGRPGRMVFLDGPPAVIYEYIPENVGIE